MIHMGPKCSSLSNHLDLVHKKRTSTVVIFGGHVDIPKFVAFHNFASSRHVSHSSPPKGDRPGFVRRDIPTPGHFVSGSRSQLGGFWQVHLRVGGDAASFASPAMPRNLEIVSRNRAAATCEADAPCSVEYCSVSTVVLDLVSSPLPNTTLPL